MQKYGKWDIFAKLPKKFNKNNKNGLTQKKEIPETNFKNFEFISIAEAAKAVYLQNPNIYSNLKSLSSSINKRIKKGKLQNPINGLYFFDKKF